MTATTSADPPVEPPALVDTGGRTPTPLRERAVFGAIVALSLGLNSWALSQNGLGNTFYSAATWSATTSAKNWFFGSFDPGGFITVDKPPVALWIEGLSARLLGFSSWSVLFPSALAGAASVALLWWILRPRFGGVAAAIGALLLAVSPINVAVNRLNLPDPFMIVFLLGSTWAVLRAAESTRWLRWVVLAGLLIGLAFNTKMLAAAIPGPALALALLIGTAGPFWNRLRRVLAFGLVCLAFAVPWIIAVDLTPASARPYMGGSTNNRVEDLVFGYNGFGRVEGNGQGRGAQFGGGRLGGAGGVFGGSPGTLRLVNDAVGGQVGWLLPVAFAGAVLALWQFRRDRRRLAAVVLWAGWFAITGLVFSYAKGTFHSYYTAALAPAVAALVALGVAAARAAFREGRSTAIVAAVGTVIAFATTVLLQRTLAGRAGSFYRWVRPIAFGGAFVAAIVVVAAVLIGIRRLDARVGGMAVVVGVLALALIPAAWAVSETANPTVNTTLPQAGPRGGLAALTFGAATADAGGEADAFAAFLRTNTDGARWNLVTTSAMNSTSELIADQHLSVMALGGFLGEDPATTPTHIAELVQKGAVRYFLAGGGFPGGLGGGGGFGGLGGGARPNLPNGIPNLPNGIPNLPNGLPNFPNGIPNFRGRPGGPAGGAGFPGGFGRGTANSIMQIVRSTCAPVTDTAVPARYRSQLYDCAGKGDALARAARAQAAATPGG